MSCTTSVDGFVPVPNWWITHPDINSNRLSVLMALARYADRNTHTCFPSQSTIAKLLDASRAWVNKIIKELVELGLIEKTNRTRDNNGTTSCLYKVQFDLPGKDSSTEKAAYYSSSKAVTGGVKESDRNKNKDKSLLSTRSGEEIQDWEVSAEAVKEMSSLAPGFDVRTYAKKFKEKVLSRGYQYPNLNSALMEWFKADHARGLTKPRPKKKRSATPPLKTTPAPAPMDMSVCSADLPEEQRQAVEAVLNGNAVPESASTNAKFRAALTLIGKKKGMNSYESWLKPLCVASIDGDCLTIGGATSFHLRHVLQNMGDDIIGACRAVNLPISRVRS